ncbi:MAG: hypothetical protein KYX68_10505 [Flavobacterium sp.]|nr:hypothetical protein [Flavobacterium sp.]
MKKLIYSLKNVTVVAVLFVASQAVISCNKDDDSSDAIQEEDVVEVIENSLKMDTGGLSKSIETSVSVCDEEDVYTQTPSINCGEEYVNNYTYQNAVNNYEANYSFSSAYMMNCDSNSNPSSFTYEFTNSGTYDTPRMSSDDHASANWEITGLDASTDVVALNGAYERIGSQVSKVRNMNTFASTLNYTINSLQVNKVSYQIQSGTIALSFIGTSSNGNQYTFSGTITFNGNQTATVVINGNTYVINL